METEEISMTMNKNDLICPVCNELMIRPMNISPCSHSLCGYCINQWREKENSCPLCRVKCNDVLLDRLTRIILLRNKENELVYCRVCDELHYYADADKCAAKDEKKTEKWKKEKALLVQESERIGSMLSAIDEFIENDEWTSEDLNPFFLSSRYILCPKGCGAMINPSAISSHEMLRHNNLYTCKCGKRLLPTERMIHVSFQCPKTKMNCFHCRLPFERGSMVSHQRHCKKNPNRIQRNIEKKKSLSHDTVKEVVGK